MRATPGSTFRLSPSDELRARLHREGWAGCERGGIEQADNRRVVVRFEDGQPWHFQRAEFEAACVLESADSLRSSEPSDIQP